MLKQFYFMQFSLVWVHSLVLFDPLIGPYQVLRLQVELDAIAIKGYSTLLKIEALLEPHHYDCLVS